MFIIDDIHRDDVVSNVEWSNEINECWWTVPDRVTKQKNKQTLLTTKTFFLLTLG